jgi:hypothetical protein
MVSSKENRSTIKNHLSKLIDNFSESQKYFLKLIEVMRKIEIKDSCFFKTLLKEVISC